MPTCGTPSLRNFAALLRPGLEQDLDVKRQALSAGFDHGRRVAHRLGDHQMSIEKSPRHRPDGFDDRGPEADVGDEVTVHDVQVEKVSAAAQDLVDLRAEFGKVGREDRGERSLRVRWRNGMGGHQGKKRWTIATR